MDPRLNECDWRSAETSFLTTSPFNYAIVDNVLAPDAFNSLRESLEQNKAWGFLNSGGSNRILYIRNFYNPLIHEVAEELIRNLPGILAGLSLVEYSAFLNSKNDGSGVHSDNGMVTVNIYLTSEEFNLDPGAGGMVLYDVKRTGAHSLHEFNSEFWCADFLSTHTKGKSETIVYRCNRAIIFDASTLHAGDRMNFVGGPLESHRLNLALRFDRPEVYEERRKPYTAQES